MPAGAKNRNRPRHAPPFGTDGADDRFDPRMLIGVAWLIGFCVYFSSSILPNNQDYARYQIGLYLPDYFSEFLFGEPQPASMRSGWRFLPQRFDLLAVAAVILAGALATGRLTLRAMGFVDSSINRVERFVFAAGLGLSALSLLTLGVGLIGGLFASVLGPLLGVAIVAESALIARDLRRAVARNSMSASTDAEPASSNGAALDDSSRDQPHVGETSRGGRVACLLAMAPFLLAMLLGAMIPESDFDVKEYHLEGPKEHFLARRITFLEHNVYTSFPFLTEMLSLIGMTLRGDWWRGALAGKVVLAAFGPLTAAAVFALARRMVGETAGWIGALIALSTPWTYRISIIAYSEGGLSFYLVAALLATFLAVERLKRGEPAGRFIALAGLLAGSAMACKYPGVLSVVIPLGAAIVATARSMPADATSMSFSARRLVTTALPYSLGVLVAVGPWLLKNLCETGNPVYPLLYSVFGGRDWDDALNAQWKKAHSPDDYDLGKLWFWITDVSARNDWLSPLLYGFAPLAFFRRDAARHVGRLWLFVAWLFGTWWLFTHRLDRFWVPMLPVVAVLAGVGAEAFASTGWRWTRTFVIGACLAFNLCVVTSPLSGPNSYLVDLGTARPRVAGYAMTYLNEQLPPGSKLLCVGAAEVFDLTVPYEYNTVFDKSLFEREVGADDPDVASKDRPLRRPDEIRRRFAEAGVTHLYVHWAEILRYRTTYGYTDFVTPARFAKLREFGLLGDPITLGQQPLEALGPRDRDELKRWAPELLTRVPTPQGRMPGWTTIEVYPVRPSDVRSP